MNFQKIKNLFFAITSAITPFLAIAQSTSSNEVFRSYEDIISFFKGLATILSGIFWIAAIIAAIYSAFLFLTAGGAEEKIKKAKDMFFYTVIAIVIALISFGLPTLVEDILKNIRG